MKMDSKIEIIINLELKSLIPPLTKEEYTNLEESIKKDGCRDSLIVWKEKNMLVDGHNRLDICTKNNKNYKIEYKSFETINDAKLWMIDNQKSRRNLTEGWQFELAQKKKEILLLKGKENIAANKGGTITLSTVDKVAHNTQKALAEDLGWSTGKVATADVVWNKAPQEIKEQIKKGEKTFNEVYKDIKTNEKIEARKEKIAKQREELKKENHSLPQGVYEVIVIDPPWMYGNVDDYSPDHYMGRVANPYPEMTTEQIKNIKIPASENCVLWLWTTHKYIFECRDILQGWGFRDVSVLTWGKTKMGIGRWLRSKTEYCVMAVKGSPTINLTNQTTLLIAENKDHSAKPQEFYDMIEELCIGRKLDYFARKKRDGWDVYGDEVK